MTARNLDLPVLNTDGIEMKDSTSGTPKETNVRMTIRASLGEGPMVFEPRSGRYMPDTAVKGEDKIRMYELAQAMKDPGEVELNSDDVALIRRCVNHLPPFIYGQICEALGELKPEKKL